MAYTKTEWKARQGTGLNRFTENERSGDAFLLTNTPYSVTEPGTSFSAENMNHIEQGISDAHEAITAVDEKAAQINTKVDSLENLGHFVGSFDTFQQLPENASEFSNGITINDFVTIRVDETHGGEVTRYIVTAIDDLNGDITWVYDITYSTDISGKADKVSNAADGNLAELDAEGNLTDSGKKTDDFIEKNEKGAANGVATLGPNGTVPASQLPSANGILAVNHDGTLKGEGTSSDPLGINFDIIHPKQIMYLTQNNAEASLAAAYGGEWLKSLTTRQLANPSGSGSYGGGGSFYFDINERGIPIGALLTINSYGCSGGGPSVRITLTKKIKQPV
jgi:hypothetical protein